MFGLKRRFGISGGPQGHRGGSVSSETAGCSPSGASGAIVCGGGTWQRTAVEVMGKAFVATGNPKQSEEIIVYAQL